jgi:glycosyltransferase involved in cell wall biosynthesis
MTMNPNISPEVRANWQVPTFDTPLWLGRQHLWCVVIPVINEGERIKSLLSRMAALKIDGIADIIIVDGGSTDGSLELDSLQQKGVRGLLVKTGPGKLSAQLRCAYAFTLDQGYEGIISIDGNDKDDPEAIPRFIEALEQGVDFVQGSRFISGGVAENTPKSRDFAIRFIHAPMLSLFSGFRWTDTTQGFRAYSRKMLLDPAISPFRCEFVEYELLAYLSHRVPQLGYQCQEIPTSRRYPKGEVPTKISAVKGNLKVFKTLLFACLGIYNAPGFTRNILPSGWPIGLIAMIGFVFSILAFFPGWMSPDSFAQYSDAKRGLYSDWHPILMAWWWRQLDQWYAGPGLFLIQNLVLYWGAWCLLALASRRWVGRYAYLIPLLGFWPGLLFPLGQIWKDIVFACSMFFAWAVLINAYAHSRKLKFIERAGVFILALFALGVKTNGMVALPFLLGFWVYVEGWQKSSWVRQVVLSLSISFMVVAASTVIVPQDRIIKMSPFQYTQTYDLLAISVKTGKNLLPSYITSRVGGEPDQLKKLYRAGGNDALFYNTSGSLITTNPIELSELNNLWIDAVTKNPEFYLMHRLDNFAALLRWGEKTTAYVASPQIDTNPYGFNFKKNRLSIWLTLQTDRHPWMFFPWIYLSILLIAMCALFFFKWNRFLVLSMGGSAIVFVLPHFFIAPAADYRYLYYAYFCALILSYFAASELLRNVVARVFGMKRR